MKYQLRIRSPEPMPIKEIAECVSLSLCIQREPGNRLYGFWFTTIDELNAAWDSLAAKFQQATFETDGPQRATPVEIEEDDDADSI